MAEFPEKTEKISKKKLKQKFEKAKTVFKPVPKHPPEPVIKEDKALVYIVCPKPKKVLFVNTKGIKMRIYANQKQIGLNSAGTYTYVYLEPGEIDLISSFLGLSLVKIKLEAGKTYYFVQQIYIGKALNHTVLSRNTKEIVMYEIKGARYCKSLLSN